MERRTEVIIAAGVLVALAIVLFMLFFRKPEAEPVDRDTRVTREEDPEIPQVDPEDIPEQNEVSATTIGRIFVERFGSYSSEADYENIDDVMAISTDALQSRLERLAEDARREQGSGYYGVSTRIITVKTESTSESAAQFLITTQREEAIDAPGNTSVRYQDIRVKLVKEGDEWLINDFTWL